MPTATGAEPTRLRDYASIALIALASRALCVLIAMGSQFGAAVDGRLASTDIASFLVRWDAEWYVRIARMGYQDLATPAEQLGATAYAYFPLYPLLIRATVAVLPLEIETAGVLISTVLFVLALILVHEYVRELGLPRETGIAAVLLICCAPHSFVFSSIYTESTFLFLLAAAMLALRRKRFLLAGLAAALLSAVRPNGVLFVVFAMALALRSQHWRAWLRPWQQPGYLLTLALAPVGLIAFLWYCYFTSGDAFAQATSIAHGWGWAWDWPWNNLRHDLGSSATDQFWAWGSLAYFAASLLLLRMGRYEEFAFCLCSFVLVWINVLPQSLVRYAVVLFPIFIALAHSTIRRPLIFAALASTLAAINAFLLVGFALQWRISV